MRALAEGSLMPAAFQRPYVWTRLDVLALCDSIISGFPIGAFLIWNPNAKADLTRIARGRLGPIVMGDQSKTRRATGLLLDGQNRLATIAWMNCPNPSAMAGLTTLSSEERKTWCSGEVLVLDHATRSICFVPEVEANVGLRFPIHFLTSSSVLPSQVALKRWDNEWKEFDDDVKNDFLAFYDQCQQRFMSARLAVTEIEDATADEARHAFIRICRVGVPMSQEDFDSAVSWTEA